MADRAHALAHQRSRGWAALGAVAASLAEALAADAPPPIAHLLVPDLAAAAALLLAEPAGLRCADFAADLADPAAARAALERALGGPPDDAGRPALAPLAPGGPESWQLLPLRARGREIGALALGAAGEAAEPALLAALADMIAVGLDNMRLHAAARHELHERAALQSALHERQALFDAIFEQAGVGIALGALEWDMLLTNRAFQRIVGYSEAELRRISVTALTHPDDREPELVLVQELLAGTRTRYQIEKRYIHKDGHEVPVLLTGLLVRGPTGEPRWCLALVEDISERRRAEAALRESEARYRSLVELQTDLVVRWRPEDGRRTFVNDAYCAFFGRAREALLGSPIADVAHPDDVEALLLYDECRVVGELAVGENRVIRADGSVAWCEWSTRAIPGPEGAPVEFQSIGRDVTARRAAEESRDRLVAILEAAPTFVGYVDLAGQVGYLNRAARELCGLPPDLPAAHIDLSSLYLPWAWRLLQGEAIPTALRTGAWSGETALRGGQGRETPLAQTVLALAGPAGQVSHLGTIGYDLSAQRRATAERLSRERRMHEAQRLESLSILAGGIAHDFNNILTAVLGHAELALQSEQLHLELRPGLEAVVRGARRAADLTQQILAYAGKGRVLLEPISLSQVAGEVATLVAASAGRHCLLLRRLAPDLPATRADAAQVRQLVLNLLLNAVEALPEAGGVVVVETALDQLSRPALDLLPLGGSLAPGPFVRLTVQDNGHGMDEATLARIFDPFFSTRFTGRGLGLSTVHGTVRGHSGAIEVRSEPGAGTRFSIWLPAERPDAPGAAPGSPWA